MVLLLWITSLAIWVLFTFRGNLSVRITWNLLLCKMWTILLHLLIVYTSHLAFFFYKRGQFFVHKESLRFILCWRRYHLGIFLGHIRCSRHLSEIWHSWSETFCVSATIIMRVAHTCYNSFHRIWLVYFFDPSWLLSAVVLH